MTKIRIIFATGVFLLLSSVAFGQNQPSRYMVLMNDQFVTNTALQDFMEWKRQKGYDVVQVLTSQVPAKVQGAPDSSEIVAYMNSLSASDYPTYLLIIGNETADKGVDGWCIDNNGYSDFYYTCRDTLTTFLPEIYYGRLPASNNNELTTMLNKILYRDRMAVQGQSFPGSNRVIVTGAYDKYDPTYGAETNDAVACYFEQQLGVHCTRLIANFANADENFKWNVGLLWCHDKIGPRVSSIFLNSSYDYTYIQDQNTTLVNNGIAILLFGYHGDYYVWYSGDLHIDELTNGNSSIYNTPLVIAASCYSAAYQHGNYNIGKALLTAQNNNGAYAYIGSVGPAYSYESGWLSHGVFMAFQANYRTMHNNSTNPDWFYDLPQFGALTEGAATKLGSILNWAKIYLNYIMYPHPEHYTISMYQLLVDPEEDIVLPEPQPISVLHPSFCFGGSTTDITITTNPGNLQVCLYSSGLGIHQVAQSVGGSVTFSVTLPPNNGSINVTVSGYGQIPYRGIIQVYKTTSISWNENMWVWDGDNTTLKGRLYVGTTPPVGSFIFWPNQIGLSGSGDLYCANYIPNSGAFLDNPANLTNGFVQRGPSGLAQMFMANNGTVRVRGTVINGY